MNLTIFTFFFVSAAAAALPAAPQRFARAAVRDDAGAVRVADISRFSSSLFFPPFLGSAVQRTERRCV